MQVRAAAYSRDRSRNLARWVVVLGFSALLHWLVFGLVSDKLRFPDWRADPATQENSVQVKLLTPPDPPVQPSPPKPAEQLASKKPAKPRIAKAKPKPQEPAPEAEPRQAATPEPQPAPAPALAAAPSGELAQNPVPSTEAQGDPTQSTGQETATVATPAASQAPSEPPAREPAARPTVSYEVAPPPSVILKYRVQALRDGQIVHGNGKITFQTDGRRYSVDGEAGVLFFTVLNFRSSGEIDHWGISPVVYSEKRFRKSATATHFQREANLITFSASTLSYPRAGGEQDRASLIWQLAGMGRGNASLFKPDATFDFFVAGVRDGESWQLRVLGSEEIDTGDGPAMAWHVVRLPRPGSYEQQLDIWLSPQQQWFPVKLRFTEKNGEYLDMALASATAVEPDASAPVANAPAATELR